MREREREREKGTENDGVFDNIIYNKRTGPGKTELHGHASDGLEREREGGGG